MKSRARCVGLWIGCLGAASCGAGVTTGEPSISITSPAQLATVQPGSDTLMSVPVAFTIQNYNLKAKCGSETNCGHVWVKVDQNLCKKIGNPYNNTGIASPIAAYFAYCMIGSHSIQLELHHDDDTAELDQNGQPVASQTINITLGTPDGG